MVAANENDNEPVRPTAIYEQKSDLPGLGDMPAHVATAPILSEANFEARQQANADEQQTLDVAQQATEATAGSNIPAPASGAGLDRPAGSFDELNSFTPAAQGQQATDAAEELGSTAGEAVAAGVDRAMDVAADVAEKVVDTLADGLADLFGGGSGPGQGKTMEAAPAASQPEANSTEAEQGNFSQDEVDQRRATFLARFERAAEATTEQNFSQENGQSYR